MSPTLVSSVVNERLYGGDTKAVAPVLLVGSDYAEHAVPPSAVAVGGYLITRLPGEGDGAFEARCREAALAGEELVTAALESEYDAEVHYVDDDVRVVFMLTFSLDEEPELTLEALAARLVEETAVVRLISDYDAGKLSVSSDLGG